MTDSHKPDNDPSKAKPQAADKWQKIAQEAEQQAAEDARRAAEEGDSPDLLDAVSRQQLEDQLTAQERQVNEYKQQAIRAHAELENVRRRAEKDVSNAHKYGIEQLINAILPALDGLIRGLESADPHDPKVKPMRDGMQLTLDILLRALSKFGAETIDPAIGADFDPKLHEAMTVRADPTAKPHTILQVLQKGYQLHGRVLKAAMVVVAQ